ncbi:MAG: hypothetical protein F6K31_08680 [Symploca sp. SIO2G7]|nr:hypothetical protein [Symploca sp. SIO2G7]
MPIVDNSGFMGEIQRAGFLESFIPNSQFPIPHSQFPIPHSPFLILNS